MDEQQGFTLFELIITLAIAAVVVGMAAPSFSTMVQGNRLSGQSLDFVAALNLARSEAIKRRVQVTLCKSANGQNCVADGGVTNWGQGWIVFVENVAINATRDANEPILRVHGNLAGNNRLTGNANFIDAISYLPSGDIVGLAGTLALCDSRNDDALSPAIAINTTGRPRLTRVAQTTMTCV